MNKKDTCVLFINTGTPDRPDTTSLRKYLKEFLMDKRVIDVPYLLRWMIVHFFILPTRPKKSAEKYKMIWEHDSPLRINTIKMAEAFQKQNPEYYVQYAMRYGIPDLESVIHEAIQNGIKKFIIFPLFPHYAMSSYETAYVAAEKILKRKKIPFVTIPPYYNHPQYIKALAESLRNISFKDYDHLLISYHSIPLRHLRKTDPTGAHCMQKEECCTIGKYPKVQKTCYLYQTKETSHLIGKALGLPPHYSSNAYQSRLGNAKWIEPSTELTLKKIADTKRRKIIIIAPSFITDGLETLEELAIRAKETFYRAGGTEFRYIPALNDSPQWIHAIKEIIKTALQ